MAKGSLLAILGLYRDNGKDNGNYYGILGLYMDDGKDNGNYYSILRGTLNPSSDRFVALPRWIS